MFFFVAKRNLINTVLNGQYVHPITMITVMIIIFSHSNVETYFYLVYLKALTVTMNLSQFTFHPSLGEFS